MYLFLNRLFDSLEIFFFLFIILLILFFFLSLEVFEYILQRNSRDFDRILRFSNVSDFLFDSHFFIFACLTDFRQLKSLIYC